MQETGLNSGISRDVGELVGTNVHHWDALIDATIAVTADANFDVMVFDGIRIVIRNEPHPGLNTCYIGNPDEGVIASALSEFTRQLEERGLLGSILFLSSLDKKVPPLAREHGFRQGELNPYMILPLPMVSIDQTAPGTVEPVTDVRGLQESAVVQSEAFEISEAYIRRTTGRKVLADPSVHLFNFRDIQDNVVSTVAAVTEGDVVSILRMATLSQEKRKGYGTALLHGVLTMCREEHGVSIAQLRSSSEGLLLYTSLGFATADYHRAMLQLSEAQEFQASS